ncbi:hypothetical protein, partial [Staphylococcus aureus]|uniref:hypothetical protein n=1 Tax=Staphylococcus aureus TaxID=1280 RepID=UPI001F212DB3
KPSTVVATAKTHSEQKKPTAPTIAPEGSKDSSPNNAAQAEFFVKLGRQKLGANDLSAAASNFSKAREVDPRSADAAGLASVLGGLGADLDRSATTMTT